MNHLPTKCEFVEGADPDSLSAVFLFPLYSLKDPCLEWIFIAFYLKKSLSD